MRYKIILLLLMHLLAGCDSASSQEDNNEEIIFTAKLHLIQELDLFSYPCSASFFKDKIDILDRIDASILSPKEYLPFSIYFVSMNYGNGVEDTDSLKGFENEIFDYCNYVVGVIEVNSSFGFFRLKGFKENDFNHFFDGICSYVPDLNEELKEEKSFSGIIDISEEVVDLDCLVQALLNEKQEDKFYPCMISCSKRDEHFFDHKSFDDPKKEEAYKMGRKLDWLSRFSSRRFINP